MSLEESNSLRLHVDPFSGVAGDMFLSSALDASPDPTALLSYVQTSLAAGMPDIAEEFRIHSKRVWRGGMGSIAATHVTVWSKWGEEAAPVPAKKATKDERQGDDGDDGDEAGATSSADINADTNAEATSSDHSHGHHHHHHHHDHSHKAEDGGHHHSHDHQQE